MITISQPYSNKNGQLQCDATGARGNYVIRKMSEDKWAAIQLFGAIGCIAAEAATPEIALYSAEGMLADGGKKKPLKMMVEIEGTTDFDLELALNEVLRLVSDGNTSGFDSNENGRFSFSILTLN